MKLGVLVVLAVVVLIPRESEGRIVSKCELREKLWRMMPKRLCDRDKDRVLAMVVCELQRRSNLNTTYEMVLGERQTAATMATTETSYEDTSYEEMSNEGTMNEGESDEAFTTKKMTTADMSNGETTTEKMAIEEIWGEDQFNDFEFNVGNSEEDEFEEYESDEAFTTEKMTTVDKSTDETTTEDMSSGDESEVDMSNEALTTEAMSDKTSTTTEAPSTKLSTTASIKSTTAVAKRRRKRSISPSARQCNLPLWRINEKLNDVEGRLDEVVKELAENMVHIDGSIEEKLQPWSLGCHGLFQLSDGYFCQTGYRYSANACGKNCSAFTDDDLTDDLECIEKMAYWRYIFREASNRCYHLKDFFSDCE